MLKKYLSSILIIILILALPFNYGCNNDDDVEKNLTKTTQNVQKPVINESAIDEIIGSFSSPVEMAALMNSLNVQFSKKYLIDPKITDNYDTNNKKAFALGVLSTNLGYLNVYKKSSLIVEYLSAIKRLSDDLRVSQFFDFQTLKRIATSNENLDSLHFLSIQSFQDMDHYLRQNSRSNLSLLVITGVWVEGLYLLTQVSKEKETEKLKERIGEQKVLFELLYPILKIYSEDPYFNDIVTDMKEYQTIFNEIKITYQKEEAETKIIDGNVTIIQDEVSIVEITDDQLKQITEKTEKIRNKLINL